MAKKQKRGRGNSKEVAVDPAKRTEPCKAVPGSREKLDALIARAAAGAPLHVAGDVRNDSAQSLQFSRMGKYLKTSLEHEGGEVVEVKADERVEVLVETSKSSNEVMTTARMSGIGSRIQRLRISRGFGLRQLAKRARIRPGQLGNIERGRWGGSVNTLWAIADALGITLDYLVGRNDRVS